MAIILSTVPGIDVAPLAAKFGKPFIADPLRAAINVYGFQTLYEMPQKLRFDLRNKLLADHAAAVTSQPDAVYDHSIFSYLADWMRWDWNITPTELWEKVLDAARPTIVHYEKIHHLPAGTPRGYDGFHWLDKRNDAQIAGLMRHLYAEFGVADRVI